MPLYFAAAGQRVLSNSNAPNLPALAGVDKPKAGKLKAPGEAWKVDSHGMCRLSVCSAAMQLRNSGK